jgi:hypothetical protein
LYRISASLLSAFHGVATAARRICNDW